MIQNNHPVVLMSEKTASAKKLFESKLTKKSVTSVPASLLMPGPSTQGQSKPIKKNQINQADLLELLRQYQSAEELEKHLEAMLATKELELLELNKQNFKLEEQQERMRGNLDQVDKQIYGNLQRAQTHTVPVKENILKLTEQAYDLLNKMQRLEAEVEHYSRLNKSNQRDMEELNNLLRTNEEVLISQRQLLKSVAEDLQIKKIAEINLNKQREEVYALRKKLNNQLQDKKGNIRVYCRIRPIQSTGKVEEKFYEVVNNSNLLLHVPSGQMKSDNHKKEYNFNFEQVFQNTSQVGVFNELGPIILNVLDGRNVCIFAYGQTGSGKTYTMEGGQGAARGVIPRSVEMLFEEIEKARLFDLRYKIFVSIREVYLENVRDLLEPSNKADDEPHEIEVHDPATIYSLLKVAMKNRSVSRTDCNATSSRSHCIFTLRLQIIGATKTTGSTKETGNVVKRGLLNLIDLAGSERVAQSKVEGDRLKETQSINKSLTLLSSVIASIAKNEDHIPFRNSKLTYLLKDSLSGDSKTLMMVNISPLSQDYQQTVCSLRFAETVKECTLKK